MIELCCEKYRKENIMEYRISNIIETLRRLPPPSYIDQQLSFPVLIETWESKIHFDKSLMSYPETMITVKARQYNDGNSTRLEWVMNI